MPALTMESSNLFIVADGMGGQQAGEQASLMAVDLIPRAIQRRLPPDEADPARIKEAIRDAVAEVNQEILGSSGAVTEFSNMGTTVVLAQFRFDRVLRRRDRRLAGLPASRRHVWNSSPRITRSPTPCSTPARSPSTSSPTTSSRMFCICTWAAKMRAVARKKFACWTCGPVTGCSWPATG